MTEDYHEIQDLLNRYKTLKDANRDLTERQKEHEEENEDKRIAFASFTKERANEILNANNEIASLQKRLEVTEALTFRLQNQVDSTIRGMSDKTLELGQILSSVENLLDRFHKHMSSSSKRRPLVGVAPAKAKAAPDPAKKRNKRADAKDSGAAAATGARSAEELDAEGRQVRERLDEIAMYMIDYKDIVEEFVQQKSKEGSALR